MRCVRGAVLVATLVLGCALLTAVHATHAQPPSGGTRLDGVMNPPPDQTTPSGTAPPPSGTVLASDNFSNPGVGLVATSAPQAQQAMWKAGYVNGEYQIASLGGVQTETNYTAFVRGDYTDVSVAVDARLVGGDNVATDQIAEAGCRFQRTSSGLGGYRLNFASFTNQWAIQRLDAGSAPLLTGVQGLSTPPMASSTHHLQITCAGNTITGSIDGQQVASVQDSTYSHGQAVLGVGSFHRVDVNGTNLGAYAGTWDARFSNLVLTQP